MPQPNISCILLAAGYSRRMGRPKLELPFGRESVLAATLSALNEVRFHEKVIVCRSPIPAQGFKIVDIGEEAEKGMHRSIRAGIAALKPCDGVCVALADQPFLRAGDYRNLLSAFSAERDLVYPEKEGRRGNPALLGSRYFPEILAHPDNDRGCQYLFSRHPERVLAYQVGEEGYFQDLDDWETYQRCVR